MREQDIIKLAEFIWQLAGHNTKLYRLNIEVDGTDYFLVLLNNGKGINLSLTADTNSQNPNNEVHNSNNEISNAGLDDIIDFLIKSIPGIRTNPIDPVEEEFVKSYDDFCCDDSFIQYAKSVITRFSDAFDDNLEGDFDQEFKVTVSAK
tara:strand:+ start:542 stop:988 length:447 start_codon:yes stop_codon:yes gene_type:complete